MGWVIVPRSVLRWEPRRGLAVPRRQSRDGVRDLLLAQADKRHPEKGTQGQCIAPVGDGAGEGDQIPDFLTAEKAFAGL